MSSASTSQSIFTVAQVVNVPPGNVERWTTIVIAANANDSASLPVAGSYIGACQAEYFMYKGRATLVSTMTAVEACSNLS